MTHNLPTRDEMIAALGTYLSAEKAWRDALHAGHYDQLVELSNQATADYKHLQATVDRLPETVAS